MKTIVAILVLSLYFEIRGGETSLPAGFPQSSWDFVLVGFSALSDLEWAGSQVWGIRMVLGYVPSFLKGQRALTSLWLSYLSATKVASCRQGCTDREEKGGWAWDSSLELLPPWVLGGFLSVCPTWSCFSPPKKSPITFSPWAEWHQNGMNICGYLSKTCFLNEGTLFPNGGKHLTLFKYKAQI